MELGTECDMRRLVVSLLALSLGIGLPGCASLGGLQGLFDAAGKSIFQGGTSITAPVSIGNIGPTTVFELQSGYNVAVRLALEYSRLRQCTRSEVESLMNPCSRRSVVMKLQTLDTRANALLARLRMFVDNNDMVSAASVALSVKNAVLEYRSEVTAVAQSVGARQ